MLETELINEQTEVEKEMQKYKVLTFSDVYKAIKEHPDWLVEIRKIILTTDLLELPKKFDELARKFDGLTENVDVLKKDVDVLKKDVKQLKDDVAMLKGDMLEMKVRHNIGAFVGKLLKKAKVLDSSDVADILYDAVDSGVILESEAEDALNVDIVAEGFLRRDDKRRVIIAIEVSNVGDVADIQRAIRRASIISKVYNWECVPMVLARSYTEGAKEMGEKEKVVLI